MATRPSTPVDFARPPVTEVAIGVQFPPVPGLGSYATGGLVEDWARRYPSVSRQPPLPRWVLDPELIDGVFIRMSAAEVPRLWFAESAGSYLLQLQEDRFIANWRSVPNLPIYPRFEPVRDQFLDRWGEVREALGSEPAIDAVEVTYVNTINAKPHVALAGWMNPLCVREKGGFNAVFEDHLSPDSDARAVRTTQLSGTYQDTPTLMLTLTVRVGTTSTLTSVEAIQFAHDDIVTTFKEITSSAMHDVWEIQ